MRSSADAAAAKLLQSCPTLCNPIDGSPPGSPIPGIPQARTLEWVAISFSNAWKWKVKVKLLSRVQLSDPMDCSLPGSSTHGIFQARVLELGAIAFSVYFVLPPFKEKGCLSGCLVSSAGIQKLFCAHHSNDLLMNLWGRKWCPHPILMPSWAPSNFSIDRKLATIDGDLIQYPAHILSSAHSVIFCREIPGLELS